MIVENLPYDITEEEQNSVINQLHQELKTIEEEDLGYKSDDEYYSNEQIEDLEKEVQEEQEQEVLSACIPSQAKGPLGRTDQQEEQEEEKEEQEIECNSNSCTLNKKEINEKELDYIIQSLENQQETLPTISSDEENSIDINF